MRIFTKVCLCAVIMFIGVGFAGCVPVAAEQIIDYENITGVTVSGGQYVFETYTETDSTKPDYLHKTMIARTVAVNGVIAGDAVSYRLHENDNWGAHPWIAEAGTYTVYVCVERVGYNPLFQSADIVISPAEVDIEFTDIENRVYTLNEKKDGVFYVGKGVSEISLYDVIGYTYSGKLVWANMEQYLREGSHLYDVKYVEKNYKVVQFQIRIEVLTK